MGLILGRGAYLLLGHRVCAIHAWVEHLSAWVGAWISLDRVGVHARLLEVLVRTYLLAHAIIWRSHLLVWMDGWRHATWGNHSWRWIDGCVLSCAPLVWMGLFARDNIDQKVKHVRLGERRGNVGSLQSATLVLLCVNPGAHGELGDEDIAAFGEEDWRFSRDHLNFWISLHDLLDSREGQLVQFVVMLVRLQLCDLLLPVCVEDVAVVAIETLVDLRSLVNGAMCACADGEGLVAYILPRSSEQLWVGSMSLSSNLYQISVGCC